MNSCENIYLEHKLNKAYDNAIDAYFAWAESDKSNSKQAGDKAAEALREYAELAKQDYFSVVAEINELHGLLKTVK